MFTGLRYHYLNLYSGSLLGEAFIICLNFHCNQYKNEKKIKSEVIKLIVKPTLQELWGAENHIAYFFRNLLFVALFQVISKTFQRGD